MNRQPPPLLGFNNNVRHNGRVFHIQTEDSGTKYCRIVTHLFADGGRILRTTRTDYSQQLGQSDFIEHVRRLMKEQHRAMFAALRTGEFDAIIKATFEAGPIVSSGVSELPASQRPALRPQELPPLSLPSPRSAAEADSVPATARLIKRPSNRPSSRPSRIPARTEAHQQEDTEQVSRLVRPNATAGSASSSRLSLGRPPMDSSERYSTSRSLFGDTTGSEQSLGDVILSYVEEAKEKGSGSA